MKFKASLIVILFSLSVKAQIIGGDSTSAGIYYLNFNAINITCPFSGGGFYYCDTTFAFDVNQDGVNDIAFYHENLDDPHVSQYFERVNILNNNIQLAVLPLDSGYIDTIKTGTWIDKFRRWREDQSPSLYLHYYRFTTYAALDGIFDNYNRYFGFRLIEPTDTLYGWFKVGLHYVTGGIDGIILYSYALNKFTNGITDEGRAIPNFKIHPNPASDVITVESKTKYKELRIYDVMGNMVRFEKGGQSGYINIIDLSPGIYQVQITYSEGTLSQKVIVQH